MSNKKKLFQLFLIPFICIILISCTANSEYITGFYYKGPNGKDCYFVNEDHGMIVMEYASENRIAFNDLHDGDVVKIKFNGEIMPSNPPRMSVDDLDVMKRGTIQGIPQDLLTIDHVILD